MKSRQDRSYEDERYEDTKEEESVWDKTYDKIFNRFNGSILCYIVMIIFIILGLVSMNYSPSGIGTSYVGGDAYNYIINSNKGTGYFVLAVLFAILGLSFMVTGYLKKILNHIKKDDTRMRRDLY